MTFIQARNGIVQGLSGYLGVPVILSDQVQPEQEPPYLYYSILSDYIPDGSLGDFIRETSPDGLTETRSEQPCFTISFTACSWNRQTDTGYIFGEDEAQEISARARGWFLHVGQEQLSRLGITAAEVTNSGDRSVLVIDEIARQYGFDVRFRYRIRDQRETGAIAGTYIKYQGGI